MPFLKQVLTVVAFLTILGVIVLYGMPKLTTAGKGGVDTGVNAVTNVTNAVLNQ